MMLFRTSLTLLLLSMIIATIMISINSVASEGNTLNPWIINDFDNLTIIKINRSLLQDLGDGYWLLVLPDMRYSDFDDIALRQVTPYLRLGTPKIMLHVVWIGRSYVVKVNETKYLDKDAVKVHERIKEFLEDIARRGLTPTGIKFVVENSSIYVIIGGCRDLNVDEFAKLTHRYFSNYINKLIVLEKLGFLPPDEPYQRLEMLDALGKIPCFYSFGEAIYGTSIVLNITCIENLAKKEGKLFSETLKQVVDEIKKLNPLIRNYLPWQEILILVAKTPRLIMPIGTASITTTAIPTIITKATPKAQAETTLVGKTHPQNTTIATPNKEERMLHQLIIPLIVIAVLVIIIAIMIKQRHP